MSDRRFNVVVTGATLDGFEPGQVQADFARLFSLSAERTAKLFAKGLVVIKKQADQATADKYLAALERIGAEAQRVALDPPLEMVLEAPDDASSANRTSSEHSPSNHALSDNSPSHAIAPPGGAAPADSDAPQAPSAAAVRGDSDQPPPADQSAQGTQDPVKPFLFHGQGTEYFRVWIVNILLTIVTLGIYSAWAKVRNAQYFYGNTELAGSRFSYHAKPLTILKGRLIAVALFVIYSLVSQLNPMLGLALSILLLVALPWIVTRALSFNRRMSGWRNVRFGFDGSAVGAAKAFVLWPLAGLLSFGLLMPLALYKQQQYVIDNSRYGTSPFALQPCGKPFYMIYLAAIGILLLTGLLGGGLNFVLPPLAPLVMVVGYLYLFAFIVVRTNNLIFNNTSLAGGEIGFNAEWQDGSYIKLVLINTLFTLLTLGFYYPWAMVRVAHYKADHLQLITETDMDRFVAAEEQQVTALGEEMGDVFDMEVGI